MGYAEFKAPKGVLKVELELEGNLISRIAITGDFFMYPEEALEDLEHKLIGVKIDRESLMETIEDFYVSTGARTPMVEPEHFVEAIMRAAGD